MENNKHLSIEFWMQLRQGISYGVANWRGADEPELPGEATSKQLDLATDNAFRTVLRELYGCTVPQCDEAIKNLETQAQQ